MIRLIIDQRAATETEMQALEKLPGYTELVSILRSEGRHHGIELEVREPVSKTVQDVLMSFPPEQRTPETARALMPPDPQVVQINIGRDQRNSGADAAGVLQINIGANQRNAGRNHFSDGDFHE